MIDIWFVTLRDAGNPNVGVVSQIKFRHEPILRLAKIVQKIVKILPNQHMFISDLNFSLEYKSIA